ncbi:sigma-54 dependent transcriptional regulator [Photobacterium sp. SDRW27]|uniref:sigma-54 interaction domain-containing protein n=1 Tax=Photobacterium obscurum TaxID=2829490 RepID=UPI0022443E1D|nr:sigma-54 dependent transcriptional regulator [Photobacterium obscurum]MCW8327380.1 sigma-54 dependent transcriptional regulator [Photobacterium obscurum]
MSKKKCTCLLYTQSKLNNDFRNTIEFLESVGWSFSSVASKHHQPKLGLAIISQKKASKRVITELLALGENVTWFALVPSDFLSDCDNLYFIDFVYSFQKINTEPFWVHHEMHRIADIIELKNTVLRASYNQHHSQNPLMQKIYKHAKKVAVADASIMLLGASGVGKQYISTFIHHHSPRKNGPFISFNCAGISPTLAKDELFGHEKGSFTGANKTHQGIFERANGGTLLLDEIGDLPLELQGNFLHVLETNEITRIGGQNSRPINVRIICATNIDLEQKIKEKQFRADLYYRLNVITLQIPSLAERKEDILSLADGFLRQYSLGKHHPPKLSAKAIREIEDYNWPGNIRELSNVIQRAVLLNESGLIQPSDLLLSLDSHYRNKNSHNPELQQCIEQTKFKAITTALSKNKGNITQAAKELGISRYTFYRQMKSLNINQ